MGKRLNLIGQRFGGLTALRPAEHVRGSTGRCGCGREPVVRTGSLGFEDAAATRKRAEKARKQAEDSAYNRFLREFNRAQAQGANG